MKIKNFLIKNLFLFLSFFKVGLFTFGGGYSMIPLIEKEICNKRKWITNLELFDILAISESTPGPISINAATYVGYKVNGFWGSVFSTIGLAIPSFIIIFIISFFYKDFMKISIIQSAFKGIKIGVIILLIMAVIKLFNNLNKNKFSYFLLIIALIISLLSTFLNWNIYFGSFKLSISLLLILFSIIICIVITRINRRFKL